MAVRRKTFCILCSLSGKQHYHYEPAFEGAAFASKRIAQEMAERHRAEHPELAVRVIRESILDG